MPGLPTLEPRSLDVLFAIREHEHQTNGAATPSDLTTRLDYSRDHLTCRLLPSLEAQGLLETTELHTGERGPNPTGYETTTEARRLLEQHVARRQAQLGEP